ncbi:MAG: hypothetical protein KOO66_09545 [Bacteroidales bacterium]|nr:hypothetical protein [Bacteroidales bacterium]
MKKYIKTIKLGGLAGNCYLIKTTKGFILIITGEKTRHLKLEEELIQLGCTSENLNLIIFTHCNPVVYNNFMYLSEKYNTKIAIHIIHEALENENRTTFSKIISVFRKILFSFQNIKELKPDLIIDEGYNLSEFGLNARVLYMPGFSNSSIGILTDNGELFCDDIFVHNSPHLNSTIANIKDNMMCLKILKKFLINIIYPGQGEPFPLQSLNN